MPASRSTDASIEQVPHRAHWQPVEYNALHGGMQRWFAPMEAGDRWRSPPGRRSCKGLAAAWRAACAGTQRWYVEAHQFRIDTAERHRPADARRRAPRRRRPGGGGADRRATTSRAARRACSRPAGRRGERFTMTEPWTLLLLDDARVIHESTPIQPLVDSRAGLARHAGRDLPRGRLPGRLSVTAPGRSSPTARLHSLDVHSRPGSAREPSCEQKRSAMFNHILVPIDGSETSMLGGQQGQRAGAGLRQPHHPDPRGRQLPLHRRRRRLCAGPERIPGRRHQQRQCGAGARRRGAGRRGPAQRPARDRRPRGARRHRRHRRRDRRPT